MDASERVMIFIDGSNVHHAVYRFRSKNNDPHFRVDFSKLISQLNIGRKLVRAYYYGSRPAIPDPEQEKFLRALQYAEISVEVMTLKERTIPLLDQNGNRIRNNDGSYATRKKKLEKGVDVALVTGLLSFGLRNVYDTAIIVGGDQDFIGAVNELKREGKRIEIAAFSDSISDEMKRAADKVVVLDQITERIRA